MSHLLECLGYVGDQVVGMLCSYRHPYRAGCYSLFGELLLVELRMCR